MCFSFAIVNIPHFFEGEPYPDYNLNIANELKHCNSIDILDNGINIIIACKSYDIFGDYRVFSYIESLLIIPISFALSVKLSNYKSIGLFTAFSIVTSFRINQFGVSATYPELWSLCFLASMYFLLSKNTKFAIPLFLLGVLAKPLILLYSPILMYIAFQSVPKQKIFLLSIILILLSSLILYFHGHNNGINLMLNIPYFSTPFIQLILILPTQILTIASIPLTLFLLFKNRSKNSVNKTLLFSVSCILFVFLALPTFTNMANAGYRMIPFMFVISTSNGILIMEKLSQLGKR